MSGAIALVSEDRIVSTTFKLKATEKDISMFVKEYAGRIKFALIEKVQAMTFGTEGRRRGMASTAKFLQNYGFLRGVLVTCNVSFDEASPLKWQNGMGCRTGGDKNVSKAKAQQLFPGLTITHAIADALLIAEYCRRTHG